MMLALLGLVYMGIGEAQSASRTSGVIGVVKEELPGARIEVTGIGYPPKRKIPEPQKRLLAQRAAIVDAYRVMSASLRGVSGYVINSSGFLQTSGYIRGAEIRDIRYYINGKVEVDLILPVSFGAQPLHEVHAEAGQAKGVNRKVDWDSIIEDISKRGYPVYYTEKQAKQITEEEWLEMRSK